jgi:hypothetical protein
MAGKLHTRPQIQLQAKQTCTKSQENTPQSTQHATRNTHYALPKNASKWDHPPFSCLAPDNTYLATHNATLSLLGFSTPSPIPPRTPNQNPPHTEAQPLLRHPKRTSHAIPTCRRKAAILGDRCPAFYGGQHLAKNLRSPLLTQAEEGCHLTQQIEVLSIVRF